MSPPSVRLRTIRPDKSRATFCNYAPRNPAPPAVSSRPNNFVTIFGLRSDGFYIEGRAEIVAPTRRPNEFKVRFDGERSIRIRFVMWEWQASPAQVLRLLQRFFAAQQRPDLHDFFPPA